MRRALALFAIALVLFAAAVFGGFIAGGWLAPDRLRSEVERRASARTGLDVRLGTVRLQAGLRPLRLRIEATQIRAERLSVSEATAEIDPLALLLGRLEARRIEAEGVVLRLPSSSQPLAVEAWTRGLERAGRALRRRPCLLPDLVIRDGRLLQDRAPAGDLPLLADVGARFRCLGIRASGRLYLRGRLEGSPEGGRLEGILETSRQEVRGRLSIRALKLAAPAPVAELLGLTPAAAATLHGSLDAELTLRQGQRGPPQLKLRARGRDVRARLAAGDDRIDLHLQAPELRGELLARAHRLDLDHLELREGALTLRGAARLQLPSRDASKLWLRVAIEDTAVAALGPLIESLPKRSRRPLLQALGRVESGTVERLVGTLDTTPAELRQMLHTDLLSRPGQVHLELAVKDATLRLGEGSTLDHLGGEIQYQGDRVALIGLRGRYEGRTLPELNAEITGLAHLQAASDLHCVEPRPVPAWSELPALREWIRSRRREPGARTWQQVRVQADWVAHPVLLCVTEDLAGSVRPEESGLAFHLERALWAGLPLSGDGRWADLGEQGEALAIYLRVSPPAPATLSSAPGKVWARGRFEIDATTLGRWRIRGARGRFDLNEGTLALHDATLQMDPGGRVEGKLLLDLASPGELPFQAAIQLADVSLADLGESAGVQGLAGHLYGGGAVRGRLEQGLPPLARATGTLSLHARKGSIARDLPVVLALVVASQPLRPFTSEDELAYDAADLVARIEGGRLQTETFTAVGRRLRVGAAASLSLLDPHALEGVVGLFFFPGLDSLISRLPLLSRVILGPNGNLVGAYFSLDGTWSDPETHIIPIRSLASGPMVDGISSLLWGGIRRIEAALGGRPVPPSPRAPRVGS